MPSGFNIMQLQDLYTASRSFEETATMPLLFVGHGSPMNAIEDNEFSRVWAEFGQSMPKPKAILCISAHWETEGTRVSAMERPRTIQDFHGFPKPLFDVEYPAPGNPALARLIRETVPDMPIILDSDWGLDHGAWSVLCRMFPLADIPVAVREDSTVPFRDYCMHESQ